MPDINITEEGVLKLLLKINPNKACGPDLITTRILKDLAREIAPFLTRIFQSRLRVVSRSFFLPENHAGSL
jgi:hypothetical protein